MDLRSHIYVLLIQLVNNFACHLVPHLNAGNSWKMEELTRYTIQTITDKKFPSVRPDWLKNPITGRNLELDGYCEDLGIAFEYNGIQHYKYTPRFHAKYSDLEYQVYKDRLKHLLCSHRGIFLIVIPYTVRRDDLCSYIEEKLLMIRSIRRNMRDNM